VKRVSVRRGEKMTSLATEEFARIENDNIIGGFTFEAEKMQKKNAIKVKKDTWMDEIETNSYLS
jgi:hypothetical protein